MFKTIFFWAQEVWGSLPPNPPRGYGLELMTE